MSKKCDWKVLLSNNTSTMIRASSKRMAQAKAVVLLNKKSHLAVVSIRPLGAARNGNKARNPDRFMGGGYRPHH